MSFSDHIDDDDSPSILFLYLHAQDWASALVRLAAFPMEASLWIWRKARGFLLWRLLPLHVALVLGAPSYIVLELLGAYPNAARERDMTGSLPVHLAAARIGARADGERIFNHLVRAFPDSVGIADGKGRTVAQVAQAQDVSVDVPEDAFSLEPEDDFMLGYSRLPEREKKNAVSSGGAFAVESGYTSFDANAEQLVLGSIEENCEGFKSGYIRITQPGPEPRRIMANLNSDPRQLDQAPQKETSFRREPRQRKRWGWHIPAAAEVK
jgi:hypothetical protein